MLNPLYNYHPDRSPKPKHVGIIPDGTRRWAVQNARPLCEAYLEAMQKLVEITAFLYGYGCEEVSIYLCSTHNLRRTQQELDAVFKAEQWLCDTMLPILARSFSASVKIAGKSELLPLEFQESLREIVRATGNYSATRLNLCVPYNPFDELEQALEKTQAFSEVMTRLWVTSPLDLVIRTAGANLLSNFLPLQSGCARIYVLEEFFNDTSIQDYEAVLMEFEHIHRRYGE